MRFVKVHRAIRFNSSPYVAGYIANNTEKRKQFKHDNVKKASYKLINNASYGKTIESVARRIVIKLLNDMEKRGNWPKSRTASTFAFSMAS